MFVLESVSFNRKNALSLLTLCACKCVCVCVCIWVRISWCVSVCWTMVNGYTLAPRELSKRLNVCLKIDSAPSRVKWTCCERRTQRTICSIESRGVTSNGGSALLGSADGDAPWVCGREADMWCTYVRFYKRKDTGKDWVWCTALSFFNPIHAVIFAQVVRCVSNFACLDFWVLLLSNTNENASLQAPVWAMCI